MSRKTDLNLSLGVDISAFEKGLADALKISTGEGKKLEKQAQMQAEAIQQQMEKIGAAQNLGQVNAQMKTLVEMMSTFGLQGSKAFQEVATQAGELKKKQEDIKKLIDANSATPWKAMGTAVRGAAQAFSLAQSGMALFGDQSEDTQKTLLKVHAAMSFAQGLEGLAGLKDGFQALGIAIKANPIFFAAMAIAAIAVAAYKLNESLDESAKSQKELNEVMHEGSKNAGEEVSELNFLYSVSQDLTLSIEERKKAVDKLQELYPNYLANISDENILNGKAEEQYYNLRDAIIAKYTAQAIGDKLAENSSKRLGNLLDIEQEIQTTENEIQRLRKTGEDFVIKGNAQEKTQTVRISNNDLIIAQQAKLAKSNKDLAKFNKQAAKEDDLLIKTKHKMLKASASLDITKDPKKDPAKAPKKPAAAKKEKEKEKESNSQAILIQALKDKRKAEDEAYLLSIKDENTRAIESLKIKQREQDEEVQLKIDGFAKIKKLTIEDNQAISALKDLKTAQDITQEKELDALIAEQKDKSRIEGIAREKKYAEDIKKITEDEYNNTLKSTDLYYKELDTKLIKSGLNNKELKDEQLKLDIQRLEQQKLNAEDYGKSIIEIDNEIANLRNGIAENSLDAMAKMNQDFNQLILDSSQRLIESMAESIGAALVTGEDVDFGSAILSAMSSFMVQFGKMVMFMGFAKVELDKAIAGFGGGGLAIVAGAVLIAAGGAMNAVVKQGVKPKALAEGGVMRGTTFGMLAEYPTANNDPEVAIRSSYLRGMIGDAVSGGGMGGAVEFKIVGRDLVGVLNRGNKDIKRA